MEATDCSLRTHEGSTSRAAGPIRGLWFIAVGTPEVFVSGPAGLTADNSDHIEEMRVPFRRQPEGRIGKGREQKRPETLGPHKGQDGPCHPDHGIEHRQAHEARRADETEEKQGPSDHGIRRPTWC